MDLGDRPADPETDAIVGELRGDDLLTIGSDAQDKETTTLAPDGVQEARQLAMGDAATINAILDAVEGAWAD